MNMSKPQDINLNDALVHCPSNSSFNVDHENKDLTDLNPECFSHIQSDHNILLEMLRDMGNYEDTTDRLDYSYNNILTDMQNKLRLLESIQKENEEMEKLKRDKVVKIPSQLQQESHSLKEVVEARQQELFELLDQQIEDLESFEEDVQNIARKFPKDSEDSEIKSLREKIEMLQVNIAKKMTELRQYKEDIWENLDSQSMEESIGVINNLNEKLTTSVEQMTTEINRVRSEVSNFNFVRATASSVVLSIVAARDRV